MQRTAFSLVELSIVLVILGLLVGGILAGQSLIHASELRAIGVEAQRYRTAVYSFRDKYFALPGDMANATSIWGDQATGTNACPSGVTADGTPGTCNGDANGAIGGGSASGPEGVRAWQQLAMAGLVEGQYTGYYDGSKITIGLNVPASKYPSAGWALLSRLNAVSNSGLWDRPGNYLQIGGESMGELWGYVLIPADMWNLDTKTDDGIADTGQMMSGGNSCVTPTASYYNSTPAGRGYNLTYSAGACQVFFRL